MRSIIRKWGHSAAVRIPAPVMKAGGLYVDTVVDITERDGRVLIQPIAEEPESLAVLLDRVTAENLHGEVDFGQPVGREFI